MRKFSRSLRPTVTGFTFWSQCRHYGPSKTRGHCLNFEKQFGLNHMGHFLLTTLLMDLLKKSSEGRIVNVSSLAHSFGNFDFDDL